jgi:outer membrane assembly lipoprotein YfiO
MKRKLGLFLAVLIGLSVIVGYAFQEQLQSLDQGQSYPKAKQKYREVLQQYPDGELAPKVRQPIESVVPPDKTLYNAGSDYLIKGQYIKSRLAFQTLLNTYPDSKMAEEVYFALGDSFYKEGGTENLLQAEDQYRNFIVLYPGSPKVPEARLKIISLNYKRIKSLDRDQNTLMKVQEARIFLQRFPGSELAPTVRQLIEIVDEYLALGEFEIAQFCADRGDYAGARSRLKTIIDKYPNFSRIDEINKLHESLPPFPSPQENTK